MSGLRERIRDALSQWSDRADGYEAGTDAVLGVLGDPDTLALIADALHQSDCAIVSLHPQPCTERGTLTDHRRAAAVVAALTDKETP